jgi:hypothetical protein
MFRFGVVIYMLVALPLASASRIKPRSEDLKGSGDAKTNPAAMIEQAASSMPPAKDEELNIKDSINGKKPEKEDEAPTLYDPGTEGLCPKIVPTTDGGSIPSMVIVTIKHGQHLPWSHFDHPDAYVEFWTGEEGQRQIYLRKQLPGTKTESYWRARTQAYNDHTSPLWDWSCLLVYDITNPTITFQVWDRDLASDGEFIGKATGNMLEIFEAEDRRGHGNFEVKFKLYDHKENLLKDRDGQQATLTVNFEIVREKALYDVTRRQGFAEAQHSAYREVY